MRSLKLSRFFFAFAMPYALSRRAHRSDSPGRVTRPIASTQVLARAENPPANRAEHPPQEAFHFAALSLPSPPSSTISP